jgi:hypothetical protein
LNEDLEEDGGREGLGEDVLRGPDDVEITRDLGHGKGVGYMVRWADTTHLHALMNGMAEEALGHGQHAQVNVDELVEKSDATL